MTVAELIEKLKAMPQEMEVRYPAEVPSQYWNDSADVTDVEIKVDRHFMFEALSITFVQIS